MARAGSRRRLATLGWRARMALLRASTRARMLACRRWPRLAEKPAAWDDMGFTAKVAWRGRHPDPRVDYSLWVDKSRAKLVVQGVFPTARTYQSVRRWQDIEASILPETYVMKACHGWNMSLLVVDGVIQGGNREPLGSGQPATVRRLRQVARAWLTSGAEVKRQRRERHYALVRPGILFEQYLHPVDHELQLFLFNGRCRFAMVFYRRFLHTGATYRLYDEHWRRLAPGTDEAAGHYEHAAPETPAPPRELIDRLEHLCGSLDHVRVDFYACDDCYYFGEFTFTHAVGAPSLVGKYDAALGRFWTR